MTATASPLDRPALIVVEVQEGFDDARFWGERDNPACEENIAALLRYWRSRKWPVACGITTNHCCETTARMAGNLGYETYFAIDATHTFGRTTPDGAPVAAVTLPTITATNLHEEFATVVSTRTLLGQ